MKRLILSCLAFGLAAALPLRAISPADLLFLTNLEHAEVLYFIDQAQPPYYLMPNLWTTSGPDPRCTDEGTGLELAALCIADSHGWIDRPTALGRVQTIVARMACLQKQLIKEYPASGGLFFHYMNADGSRYKFSNMGTDDGARFLNGALTARQYFNDATVTKWVNQIYGAINWQAWVGTKHQAFESWTVESGFGDSQWGRYSEGPLQVYLLGLGSPTPANAFKLANWNSWTRGVSNTYGTSPAYTWIGNSPALFVHQFPQAFLFLYGMTDNSAAGGGVNYWNNSVQATLAQWQWSQDIALHADANGEGPFPLWGMNLWGLTASNSAPGPFNTWGGPQASIPPPDGTLTPAAAGGSLPFAPAQSLQTLEYMSTQYPSTRLTDPVSGHVYGFVDAFNPEASPVWYDNQFSTNGAGQTLIMAENYVSGLIWKTFMSAPEIVTALNIAQVTGRAVAPAFSPVAGTYTGARSVTIASATVDAAIRYTTDGSAPSPTHGTLYAGPVTVGVSLTLKAIAYAPALTNSTVTSGSYTIH